MNERQPISESLSKAERTRIRKEQKAHERAEQEKKAKRNSLVKKAVLFTGATVIAGSMGAAHFLENKQAATPVASPAPIEQASLVSESQLADNLIKKYAQEHNIPTSQTEQKRLLEAAAVFSSEPRTVQEAEKASSDRQAALLAYMKDSEIPEFRHAGELYSNPDEARVVAIKSNEFNLDLPAGAVPVLSSTQKKQEQGNTYYETAIYAPYTLLLHDPKINDPRYALFVTADILAFESATVDVLEQNRVDTDRVGTVTEGLRRETKAYINFKAKTSYTGPSASILDENAITLIQIESSKLSDQEKAAKWRAYVEQQLFPAQTH